MRRIFVHFENQLDNIWNNLLVGFLALHVIVEAKKAPLKKPITLPVHFSGNKLSARFINTIPPSGSSEYAASVGRSFLNSMVVSYERYATQMVVSHRNGQVYKDPADDKTMVKPQDFEALGVFDRSALEFFNQLRYLRNTMVHYNGVYNVRNPLDYTFGPNTYQSAGHEGQLIHYTYDVLPWIHTKLKDVVQQGNAAYFSSFPLP